MIPLAYAGARLYARGLGGQPLGAWGRPAGRMGKAGSRRRGWWERLGMGMGGYWAASRGDLEVETSLRLGPGQALFVVRAGEHRFLIGVTAQAIQLISQLPAPSPAGSRSQPAGVSATGLPVWKQEKQEEREQTP